MHYAMRANQNSLASKSQYFVVAFRFPLWQRSLTFRVLRAQTESHQYLALDQRQGSRVSESLNGGRVPLKIHAVLGGWPRIPVTAVRLVEVYKERDCELALSEAKGRWCSSQ